MVRGWVADRGSGMSAHRSAAATAGIGAAVAVRRVSKTFSDTLAVDALDLEIPRGALYGFIGPNGAGKTTTIRMIMSILFPDSGSLEVLGKSSALEAKDRIGYLPEERGVYRKMKIGAYLSYIARLKGVDDADLDGRVRKLVERIGLHGVEDKKCEELSKGMLQKIQFVAAIIHEPDLLILDEPFSGLDPISMRLLRDLIVAEHERGATILFSTHVMPQAEEICDHVVMIHRGRKVLDDPVSAIRGRFDPRTISFEPLQGDASVAAVWGLAGIEACERADRGYEIRLREGSDPAGAIRAVTAAIPVARIELKRPRLEDVFVQLVKSGDTSVESEQSLRAELQGIGASEVTE
jgi:ABC-2 type transport system ATP-binding protein